MTQPPRNDADTDWFDWHAGYDEEGSLRGRLLAVQQRVAEALSAAPPGPIRLISMCAGQGRDVIGVLPDHPRRADVVARLVESDPRNTSYADRAAAAAGLDNVVVVCADASLTSAYDGLVPADVVLVCGVFGNISDDDIRHTVETLPQLCRPGSMVIWTRGRWEPDLTPTIRQWFTGAGFTEVAFDTDGHYGVGTNRLSVEPPPLSGDTRLFTFIGDA